MRVLSPLLVLSVLAPSCLGAHGGRHCKLKSPPSTTASVDDQSSRTSTTAAATTQSGSPTSSDVAPTSSSATPSSPGARPSGVKRGLSYNDATLTRDFNSGQVSWAYNWASTPDGELPPGVTYFPLLWGAGSTGDWQENAETALANGATHLLGFNEPDLPAQANLSASDAAQLWMAHMQPFAGRATLVAPAITNGPPPAMGTGWLDQFFAACAALGCTVDAVAAHVYASPADTGYWKTYISGLGTRYGRPVLVTEFQAEGSPEEEEAFLREMVPFLDGLESVSHYAWFMTTAGNLVNGDGSLTPVGQAYVSS